MKRAITLIFALMFVAASVAFAQDYGSIYGTVTDKDGAPLPGVNVTISSAYFGDKAMLTSETGTYRFLRLPVASDYAVKFELQGFNTVIREKIRIAFGMDARLDIVMEQAALKEEVTVVAETPLINMKKAQVGVTVTTEMLTSLPTGKNVFVLMDLAPGVQLDKVDVGGAEGGSQGGFSAHGSILTDTSFLVDGGNVNDILRSTTTIYFKPSNYEEVHFNYAANDIATYTGGVQINLVTKRGGNKYSGSMYLDYTRGKPWELNNIPPDLKATYQGEGLNKTAIYGATFGGPIVKDKAWFFLTWGTQDLDARTLIGTSDKTLLEGGYAKLNFQLTKSTRAELFLEFDYKGTKDTPALGSAAYSNPGSYQNQYTPTYTYRIELEQTFGNLLLTGFLSYVDGHFMMKPNGWDSGKYVRQQYYPFRYQYDNNNILDCYVKNWNFKTVGTYFADNVMGADHEVKFGVDYQPTDYSTMIDYQKNVILHDYGDQFLVQKQSTITPFILAEVRRRMFMHLDISRISAFAQDTMSFGRWSLNLGVRYDREKSMVIDQSVPATPLMSSFLPGISVDKIDPGLAWNSISPRVSLSFDIFGTGKDVIKLSVARYPTSSQGSAAQHINPSATSYIRLVWIDANKNTIVEESELWGWDAKTDTLKDRNDYRYWFAYTGFNPLNPTQFTTSNKLDPDFSSPLLDEMIVSYEKELVTDLAARAEFFYRKRHNLIWNRGIFADGHLESKDDYYVAGRVSRPAEGLDKNYYGRTQRPIGTYRGNSKNQEQKYIGAQLVFTKRFSRKWMGEASFTYSDWKFHYNGDYTDPTNVDFFDGGPVMESAGGRGVSNIFANTHWMAKLSGLYQLPYGINISGSLIAREGFIIPRTVTIIQPNVGTGSAYAGIFGDTRLPTFWMANMRLEKLFQITESVNFGLALDAFNVTNNNMALSKETNIDLKNYMQITRLLNPTVFKIEARLNF